MENLDRMQIRLPNELKEWLRGVAKKKSRSMNSQMIDYLNKIKEGEQEAKAA